MKKIVIVLTMFIALNSFGKTYNHAVIQGLIEQEIGEVIVSEVYNNLGYGIKITRLPGARAADESSTGKKDGEIMRVFVFGNAFPTLVRVPTPYYLIDFTGFIRSDSGVTINSKEDLKKYKVGYVRGVKIAADLSEGVRNITEVNSTEQLVKMVNSGRVDVGLITAVDGRLAAKKFNLTKVVELDKPLLGVKGYHYLHIKNKSVVDKIDAELQRMKSTGELEKLVKKAENIVFGRHLK